MTNDDDEANRNLHWANQQIDLVYQQGMAAHSRVYKKNELEVNPLLCFQPVE